MARQSVFTSVANDAETIQRQTKNKIAFITYPLKNFFSSITTSYVPSRRRVNSWKFERCGTSLSLICTNCKKSEQGEETLSLMELNY
jgi:hypothetical protein